MFRKTYSFTAAGGGVPGRAAGIALITMTEAGVITEAHRLFTETFLQDGEMITGSTDGKDIRGKVSGYRIRSFSATGRAGKKTGTGKETIPGACRDCLPEKGRVISNPVKINPVNRRADHRADRVISDPVRINPVNRRADHREDRVIFNPVSINPVNRRA